MFSSYGLFIAKSHFFVHELFRMDRLHVSGTRVTEFPNFTILYMLKSGADKLSIWCRITSHFNLTILTSTANLVKWSLQIRRELLPFQFSDGETTDL